MSFYTISGKNYTLSSSISSTATSITLSSFTLPITGQAITMATANTDILYGTLQPGTTNSELISFTGITQNASGTATLTGVTRGLDREYPYTESSDFKLPHPGQSIFILSDAPQVFASYTAKDNDETVTGSWSFPTPTLDSNPATKEYADDLAIAGAPNATTTVKGIVEIATQAEVDARTATGGTGASLVSTPALNRNVLTHDYAVSSAGSDAYAITLTPAVTAYTTGDIYYFKADVANTGACSLNVNALGAKSIKIGGADPYDGYIAANSYVECQYDGTNMNIIWCSTMVPISQKGTEIYGASSTGNDTYVITLLPVPTSYSTGMSLYLKVDVANTGAATLNVNSLGAKSIKKNISADLQDNDLMPGAIYTIVYDGTNFQLQNGIKTALILNNTSPADITTSTTTTQYTTSIPANTFRNGSKIKAFISWNADCGTGGPNNITYALKFGGTTLISQAASYTAVSGVENLEIETLFLNSAQQISTTKYSTRTGTFGLSKNVTTVASSSTQTLEFTAASALIAPNTFNSQSLLIWIEI